MTLNLDDPNDVALMSDLEGKIDGMIDEYNQHVLSVSDNAIIESLLDSATPGV